MRSSISARLVGIALAGALGSSTSHAQPPPEPPSQPDLDRARDLDKAAEAAIAEGRYADALRDYGAAHELTRDPALLFKLGRAHQELGECDAAVDYYRRYLEEARPAASFVALTRERIAACGAPATDAGTSGAGSAAEPPAPPSPSAPGAAETTPPDGTSGAATEPTPAPAPAVDLGRHRGPWLLLGGAIAAVTAGAVLAYSANAAERDIEDLYVGIGGRPPAFDEQLAARYRDAVDEGRRYERLSLISFGAAGALAIGATIWFLLDRDAPADALPIAPTVTPGGGAGVTTQLRF
ncbi:MAG: tetratricopeptide repeat protein [Kofleriaceae bacterium]